MAEAALSFAAELGVEKAMKRHTLYGWHLSYFSGKLRSYLAYKQIPFDDRDANAYQLMVQGKRKTGVVAMPLLRTPENVWMQDTSDAIEYLERRFPNRAIVPSTPRQRFLSYWLEAWADEWWIPIAMQTRWRHPENYSLFEHDAGGALLPGFPSRLQKLAAARIATRLRGYLPAVGVRDEQDELLSRWTLQMLDALEQHFESQRYLLGDRPSLADFALMGPMYGHLGRDPWPARELIKPRRHLRAWIDRMAKPEPSTLETAAWPADDVLPLTLQPVIMSSFNEFLPMLVGIATQLKALAADWPLERRIPRSLADVEAPMLDGTFRRAAMPYTLWMAQRALNQIDSLPAQEAHELRAWLGQQGAESLLDLGSPALARDGLQARFKST